MLISISLDGSTSPAVNVDGFGSLGGDIVTDYSVLMEMMVMVVVVQKAKLRCEMYTEILSPSFVGMTFNQASVLCFSKVLNSLFVRSTFALTLYKLFSHQIFQLELLLLAIETKSDTGKS